MRFADSVHHRRTRVLLLYRAVGLLRDLFRRVRQSFCLYGCKAALLTEVQDVLGGRQGLDDLRAWTESVLELILKLSHLFSESVNLHFGCFLIQIVLAFELGHQRAHIHVT